MKKIVTIFIFFIFCVCETVYASNETDKISNSNKIFYTIKNDDCLWVFDDNDKEFLSAEKILDDVVSVSRGYAITIDNTLWDCTGEQPVKIADTVKSISVGYNHVLIVKQDNTLWGYGNNADGKLGLSEDLYETPVKIMNNVEKAEAGSDHSIVLKTDGSVWTFGSNLYGQLGYGDIRSSSIPHKIMENMMDIVAGTSATFAIDINNDLFMCGTMFGNADGNDLDRLIHKTPIKLMESVKDISVDYKRSLVLKTDDTLWQYAFSDWNDDVGIVYISDDVNSIGEWTENGNKKLVLKNNGELYMYQLEVGGHTFEKVTEGVKLPIENYYNNQKNFTDILSKSEEEQKAITSLTKAGIINGVSETEFSPDKSMTRAEIAALLLRMTAEEGGTGNGGFYDVSSDDWYCGVASKSAELGIVKGFEDNTFRGEDTISKLQFVSLVSRTLEKERDYEYKTNDNLSVPDWAKEDVSLAISAGLISENENLDGDITRSEAAVILYKLYDLI